MKKTPTHILLSSLFMIYLGSLSAHAQSNYLNLYSCNGIQESVPPNPLGRTFLPESVGSLTICGLNLQNAQQIANGNFAQISIPGWQIVGQCVLVNSSSSFCTTPGLI
jgi:hypothetical protein